MFEKRKRREDDLSLPPSLGILGMLFRVPIYGFFVSAALDRDSDWDFETAAGSDLGAGCVGVAG